MSVCKFTEVMFLTMETKPFASCDDCEWDSKFDSGSAKTAAKWHVVKTGHRVAVESKEVTQYWPPERPS